MLKNLRQLQIYISHSHDPYLNLAFENWLFTHFSSTDLLFIYRNQPCVVIGRNQNPWKEVNLDTMNLNSIPLLRRYSGGGAVYHDLGNTNYCHMMPRHLFDRKTAAPLVVKALNNSAIPVVMNERHDITLFGQKVSGSAFKIMNDKAYHHGTMLINSNIPNLSKYLTRGIGHIIGSGTESVKSNVTNLQRYSLNYSHLDFVTQVIKVYQERYGVSKVKDMDAHANNTEIRSMYQHLKSREWIFGKTPKFKLNLKIDMHDLGTQEIELYVEKGVITNLLLPSSRMTLSFQSEIRISLVGQHLDDLRQENHDIIIEQITKLIRSSL